MHGIVPGLGARLPLAATLFDLYDPGVKVRKVILCQKCADPKPFLTPSEHCRRDALNWLAVFFGSSTQASWYS